MCGHFTENINNSHIYEKMPNFLYYKKNANRVQLIFVMTKKFHIVGEGMGLSKQA